jgi:hypothetical protein
MIRALLRWFGYVSIDYGFSCGRYWVEIDGKVIAQTPGDDLWMKDNDVRLLAMAVAPGCVWKAQEGDEWFVQAVKMRWPWHDHQALQAARAGRTNETDSRTERQ